MQSAAADFAIAQVPKASAPSTAAAAAFAAAAETALEAHWAVLKFPGVVALLPTPRAHASILAVFPQLAASIWPAAWLVASARLIQLLGSAAHLKVQAALHWKVQAVG